MPRLGLFDRGRKDPEQTESRERVEHGGIPLAAERRLQALAADGTMFTSGLSVNEFSLLRRLGSHPLAQVMGASVVRPGLQLLPALNAGVNVVAGAWYAPVAPGPGAALNRITDASMSQVRSYKWRTAVVCELDVLTDAWNTARRRALDRLAEEALQVGADAVAGVHLNRSQNELGPRTIEYVVTGTAIRLGDSPRHASPKLTNASVQDLWRLHHGGYEAVGLLAATVVVFASAARATRLRRLRTTNENQELTELSDGFHTARDVLRVKLGGQVSDVRADGAVGVAFSHSVHREKLSLASSLTTLDRRGWHTGRLRVPYYVSGRGEAQRSGWVITMHAAGTAVRRCNDASPEETKTTLRMRAR